MMKKNYNAFLRGGILIILISISFFSKAQEKTQPVNISDAIQPVCQPKPSNNSSTSVMHIHGPNKANYTTNEQVKDSSKQEPFMFPNPLPQGQKGKLNFKSDSSSHYTVHIFNASGAEINRLELGEDKSFAADQLLPADYFYIVRDRQEGIVCRGRFAVK